MFSPTPPARVIPRLTSFPTSAGTGGLEGDWRGEIPGGSTYHHLPPPAAVGARRRLGPVAPGAEGSKGFAGLKDAPRRGFVLPGCQSGRMPGVSPALCLPPSPPKRFICHLTPIAMIVCNCDMIYCPGPRHFSFHCTSKEGIFNFFFPLFKLSDLKEAASGEGVRNEEPGTERRSLGEATRGRREEREELNGKVTFQASSRRVLRFRNDCFTSSPYMFVHIASHRGIPEPFLSL